MKRFILTILTLLLCICIGRNTPAQTDGIPVPKQVRSLIGTYKGEWTSFGINDDGQVVRKASWTDTLKAANPVVESGRAYVNIADTMNFDNEHISPMTVPGKEGYMLKDDGTLGDYFIETFGQTYVMQKLDENTWAYTAPAHEQELANLGFTNVLSGRHVLVKIVTLNDKTETHRISRLTTVNWKDKEGKERWIQFVSMQGQHQRTLTN